MAIVAQQYGVAFQGTVWPELMEAVDRDVDAYTDPDDASYWYGEAPLTAILGAQARRVSDEGWFLVEPSAQGAGPNVRFVDLWMGFGPDDDEMCTVEAKFLFADRGGQWLDRAGRELGNARDQLSDLEARCLVGAPISLLWASVFASGDADDAVAAAFSQAIVVFGDDPNVFVVAFEFDETPVLDGFAHPGFLAIGRLEADLWG